MGRPFLHRPLATLLAGCLMAVAAIPVQAASPSAPNRLERRLQAILGARKGSIVVMAVSDGKLQAVVNPALAAARALPPGSVMKVPTLIAAWEERLITPQRTIVCNGPDGDPPCWKPHGPIDVIQAISLSCSAYVGEVGRELGPQKLRNWWARFGFGRLTGADLPGEVPGQLPDANASADLHRNAIGDSPSISVTPLQLASFYAALANGGHRWRPSLRQPKALSGLIVPGSTRPDGLDMQVIRLGLQEAVNSGSAKGAASKGLEVAGKTGTASMPGFKGRTSGWFVGFAPAQRPEIVVVVQVDDGNGYTHATPLARQVLQVWQEEKR